jgi:hypothetical protein
MNNYLSKYSLLVVLFTFFSLLGMTSANAQDCGCTYTIELNQEYVDATKLNVKIGPGSVICLKAGTRRQLKLMNFIGTAANPIIVKNCGGQAVISNTDLRFGISIEGSRHLKITGTGATGIKHGIKIARTGRGASGLGIGRLSTDIEAEFMEIGHVGFAGILAKTDGAVGTWMQNLNFHDNYIHDCHGEGFYIGETKTPGQNIRNVKIWNNVVENSGWENFQISNGVDKIEIHNNVFFKGGQSNVNAQNKNFQIGDNTTGKFYNNVIMHSPSNAVIMMGSGKIDFYNNYIEGSGADAFFIDSRSVILSGTSINITDNYIVDTRADRSIFTVYNSANKFNISNNKYTGSNRFMNFGKGAGTGNVTMANNTSQSLSKYQFRNSGSKDYRIATNSPYAGIGLIDGNSSGTAAPVSFTANAGGNKTLTLPVNSTVLAGSATGTVSSWAWTKVSGPAATMTGTTSANLNLNNLTVGTYVFRLTARNSAGTTANSEATVTVNGGTTTHRVTSFTLVNADNNRDIATLSNNYVIDYATIGTRNIAIRANTNPGTVGSVVFTLNGTNRTDNAAPYSYSGDAPATTGTNYSALSPVLAVGTHRISANAFSATNGGGTAGTAFSISFSVADGSVSASSAPVRINCGGGTFTNNSGHVYSADQHFIATGSATYTNNNIADILNTSADALYKSERSASANGGTFNYSIPVANGNYKVVLHFAEIWFGATGGATGGTGSRVFNVDINGTRRLSNFDIIASTGSMKSIIRQYDVTVTNGKVDLRFISTVNKAKISAIEILPVTSTTTVTSTSRLYTEEAPLSAYPNPFADRFTVNMGEPQTGKVNIQLYDQLGRIVYQKDATANGSQQLEIDLGSSNLTTGLYILRLQTEGHADRTLKVIKE